MNDVEMNRMVKMILGDSFYAQYMYSDGNIIYGVTINGTRRDRIGFIEESQYSYIIMRDDRNKKLKELLK